MAADDVAPCARSGPRLVLCEAHGSPFKIPSTLYGCRWWFTLKRQQMHFTSLKGQRQEYSIESSQNQDTPPPKSHTQSLLQHRTLLNLAYSFNISGMSGKSANHPFVRREESIFTRTRSRVVSQVCVTCATQRASTLCNGCRNYVHDVPSGCSVNWGGLFVLCQSCNLGQKLKYEQ